MEKKEKPVGGDWQRLDGAYFPDKDTILSAQKAWEILNFKNDPTGQLSAADLRQLLKGQFTVNYPKFSFFRAPIKNTIPSKEIDLLQLYKVISGTHYKQLTEVYRAMHPGTDKIKFKSSKFDYVTIAGIFTARKNDGLQSLSGYAVFDFDHVQEPEALKQLLIADENLNVQMCFISPSGDGLKMILFNDDSAPYDQFYSAVTNYLKSNYPSFAGTIDSKTKDTARACFICHDANCYIKSQYLELWQASNN